jgi:hypothetical protein
MDWVIVTADFREEKIGREYATEFPALATVHRGQNRGKERFKRSVRLTTVEAVRLGEGFAASILALRASEAFTKPGCRLRTRAERMSNCAV